MAMECKNAVIESVSITRNPVLNCWLHLNYGGSGQGFGGYALDTPVKDGEGRHEGRVGSAWGMQFILRIMETVGVERWEDLPGKSLRVECDHSQIYGIGHFLDNKWFFPGTDESLLKLLPEAQGEVSA